MKLLTWAFTAALTAFAQSPAPSDMTVFRQPTVRATGSAILNVKPDQVRIDIGVVTQASAAQQAAADNARQFTTVMAELKKALGPKSDIQTVSYGITPNYRYPKEGGTPTIVGYTATNVVRVTSEDVDSAGKVIDAASRVGANAVRGIEFSLKDEKAVRAKALADAARQARTNAETMASGVGLKVVRILRLEDISAPEVRPMERSVMMAAKVAMDSAPTPVESGNIRVEANVAVIAELGN
jgi:uncharacterized protein YggE